MIRPYQKEDADYIVQSHYTLYNQEFGYDLSFKDFVQEKVNGFIERACPEELIWIIDHKGTQRGSISINKLDDETAQLGLFLIDPLVRGCGYGHKLLEESIHFCRQTQRKRIILYTSSELTAARKLYEIHGFIKKEEWSSVRSNKELTEELWEKKL